MMQEQIFEILERRQDILTRRYSGWDVDEETGAILIYAINAIFYQGNYYSMETGEVMFFGSYVDRVRKIYGHKALQVPGTGVIVYRKNAEGKFEVLLQLRTDFNLYGLPGGAIELGETYEKCAVKELLQETAYSAKPEDMELLGLYAGPKHVTKYPSGDIVFHSVAVYRVNANKVERCNSTYEYDPHETKKIVWVTIQNIQKLLDEKLVFPNNIPIFEDIVNKYFK